LRPALIPRDRCYAPPESESALNRFEIVDITGFDSSDESPHEPRRVVVSRADLHLLARAVVATPGPAEHDARVLLVLRQLLHQIDQLLLRPVSRVVDVVEILELNEQLFFRHLAECARARVALVELDVERLLVRERARSGFSRNE
jgi:hypothetical protein